VSCSTPATAIARSLDGSASALPGSARSGRACRPSRTYLGVPEPNERLRCYREQLWRLRRNALVVVVLQFPFAEIDTDPPTCFGMFYAWTVPCGGWPTLLAGVVTAVLEWVVLLARELPRLT